MIRSYLEVNRFFDSREISCSSLFSRWSTTDSETGFAVGVDGDFGEGDASSEATGIFFKPCSLFRCVFNLHLTTAHSTTPVPSQSSSCTQDKRTSAPPIPFWELRAFLSNSTTLTHRVQVASGGEGAWVASGAEQEGRCSFWRESYQETNLC